MTLLSILSFLKILNIKNEKLCNFYNGLSKESSIFMPILLKHKSFLGNLYNFLWSKYHDLLIMFL